MQHWAGGKLTNHLKYNTRCYIHLVFEYNQLNSAINSAMSDSNSLLSKKS
jgi:hypothetical protein